MDYYGPTVRPRSIPIHALISVALPPGITAEALSLNVVFISRDALGVFHWSLTISLYFCFLFLFLQLKEFKYLGFYKNDSTNGCCFIFLSGLHFFHVVVGFIIIGITSNSVLNTVMMNLYSYLVISVNLYLTVQILYWHFVEVVWLFIFLILFYYYIYFFLWGSFMFLFSYN